MARLPVSGATIAALLRSELELGDVLAQLCPDATFKKAELHEIYAELGRLYGRWSAERNRLDITPLQTALIAIGKSLDMVETTFASHETGLREIHDIEIVSQLVKILAIDPEIGSRPRANELITSFQQDATRIADACRIAAADFGWAAGKAGRPKLEWHDDFTVLLLKISRKGGVEPRLGKDRITGARTGWLMQAARELETFFDPAMRSADDEARGKRLERSRGAIKQRSDKTPP